MLVHRGHKDIRGSARLEREEVDRVLPGLLGSREIDDIVVRKYNFV